MVGSLYLVILLRVWVEFALVVLIYSCYWCFGFGFCIGLIAVVYFVVFVWV